MINKQSVTSALSQVSLQSFTQDHLTSNVECFDNIGPLQYFLVS